jgi:hypothetical protein
MESGLIRFFCQCSRDLVCRHSVILDTETLKWRQSVVKKESFYRIVFVCIYFIVLLFLSIKMEILDKNQDENIRKWHAQVEEYQTPFNCGELTLEHYDVLAELQAIYNVLTNTTLSNTRTILSNDCKGVLNQINKYLPNCEGKDAKKLYEEYVAKYKAAKKNAGLDKLLDISD